LEHLAEDEETFPAVQQLFSLSFGVSTGGSWLNVCGVGFSPLPPPGKRTSREEEIFPHGGKKWFPRGPSPVKLGPFLRKIHAGVLACPFFSPRELPPKRGRGPFSLKECKETEPYFFFCFVLGFFFFPLRQSFFFASPTSTRFFFQGHPPSSTETRIKMPFPFPKREAPGVKNVSPFLRDSPCCNIRASNAAAVRHFFFGIFTGLFLSGRAATRFFPHS